MLEYMLSSFHLVAWKKHFWRYSMYVYMFENTTSRGENAGKLVVHGCRAQARISGDQTARRSSKFRTRTSMCANPGRKSSIFWAVDRRGGGRGDSSIK